MNLTGLRYFKNLLYLHCGQSNSSGRTYIPELPNTLKYFNCLEMGHFSTMPALPPGLEYFNCAQTDFPNLPSLPPGLKYFDCSGNYQITSLPALPNSLAFIDCSGCQLTSLPSLPLSLKQLLCNGNHLASLPSLPPLLDTLNCTISGNLISLPLLPSGLTYLSCGGDSLTTLPSLPANLKYLSCESNPLSNLPALPAGLVYLDCSNGIYFASHLTSLPSLPSTLRTLYCRSQQITSLPALPASCQYLECRQNLITDLPTLPLSLLSLGVENNQLHSLPSLPDSLQYLTCDNNPLYTLPLLPDSLKLLTCTNDSLTHLPALPAVLIRLYCTNNMLTELPELPNTITDLDCRFNNIYCLPKLPTPVVDYVTNPYFYGVHINYDADKIKCIPNYNRYLYIDAQDSNGHWGFVLCNPTNNIYGCQSFPVMGGTAFYDNNSNGIKDIGEPVKKNFNVALSNGSFTFTNNLGYYEIGTDSLGNYTTTVIPPLHFSSNPLSFSYNFTTNDTLVTGNFALQANSTIDSLAIHLYANRARPGFSFPYYISYENAGTTALNPNITFNYDNTKLTYDSSTNAAVVNNGNNLTLAAGSFVPGQQDNFIAYFTVKTTAAIGDSLIGKVVMSANSNNYTDSNLTVIRGAFDPNDKQATPQLSPSQVASGKYIDYTIRFQNTGNDTAFNIVISDTLNEDLQASTLQMLVSSHSCKATVKDNIVFFEFRNILLADKNINEPMSHGFVSFRIQPAATVLPNTIIPNKAAIYFDYNAAVITNTAGTLIKDFTVVPLHLISFSAVPQTDNTTSLYWNTTNEINTQQFVIEQGIDGARFNSISTVTAKGKANNNYTASIAEFNNGLVYYRLKMVDKDGSFTYSPIIKIDRRKNAAGFSILTNPVKDFIMINTTDRSLDHTTSNIINTQGAVVKSFIITQGSQAIDIKGLPAGIYYLQTTSGNSKILIR
jgi:uncharacterized repeat protein (TIGR01451 family)